jgi:uncharacterized protein DUF5681
MTNRTSAKLTAVIVKKNQGDSSSLQNRGQTGRLVPGGDSHRWKPGQSGNPGGRPKTGALAKACRDLLERQVPGDSAGRTYAQAIAERLADLSLKGHLSAIRELGDRAEGRAGQLLNVEIRPASDAGELELRPVESLSIEPTLEIGNEDEHPV